MTYTSGAHLIAYRGGYVDNCEPCVYDHEPHHRHDWDNQLPLRADTNPILSMFRDSEDAEPSEWLAALDGEDWREPETSAARNVYDAIEAWCDSIGGTIDWPSTNGWGEQQIDAMQVHAYAVLTRLSALQG